MTMPGCQDIFYCPWAIPEEQMKRVILGACLALSFASCFALGPVAAWAQNEEQLQVPDRDSEGQTALDIWILDWSTPDPNDRFDVPRPPPPSGPATIFCGPSDPECP
jgi:hypothetical protein